VSKFPWPDESPREHRQESLRALVEVPESRRRRGREDVAVELHPLRVIDVRLAAEGVQRSLFELSVVRVAGWAPGDAAKLRLAAALALHVLETVPGAIEVGSEAAVRGCGA